jgi:hypothetical protein
MPYEFGKLARETLLTDPIPGGFSGERVANSRQAADLRG